MATINGVKSLVIQKPQPSADDIIVGKRSTEEPKQCKAYTEATGRYSSFYKGEQCKRKAVEDGYCKQHAKQHREATAL